MRKQRSCDRKTSHGAAEQRLPERASVVANRRIFYDWTFRPPKSVSVVALLQDSRIIEAHTRAVSAALKEPEKYAETRVRRGQKHGGRVTANIAVTRFRHVTTCLHDHDLG